MSAKTIKKSFILIPESCDEISDLIMTYCRQVGIETKPAFGYRLAAEECMLYWMDHGLKGNRISLSMGRYMFVPFVEIGVEGHPSNPYNTDSEDFGSFTDSILVSLNLEPEYTYEKDVNRIFLSQRLKCLFFPCRS